MRLLLCLFLIFLFRWDAWAGQWMSLGPDGGDVRSLAYDPGNPDRIFLGTSTGTIFQSTDEGRNWRRFVHLGKGDDLVIDHMVIDPRNSKNIYVGTWHLDNHHTGELFRSYDGGKHWVAIPAMHGKSIRALTLAGSDPKILVVGALDGVFRSKDGGQTWHEIGQNAEIKNVESIAIDPKNSDVIFAGTRHLAWKTLNAGASWHRVREGIIDDSDVFSIIVDESNSKTVFLSACSGIYKSIASGHAFERVQAIPFSARRTRVLKQDPSNPAVVYAGTTEGLWVTGDSGKTWKRVTRPEIVVNDVLIDPRDSGRVLLATDRAGVLASDNTQLKFIASNSGFTHRYLSSVLADQQDPNLLYAAVVNDRELGGVFVSRDAGEHWVQMSAGLDGRDIFVLKQLNNGSILAGTNKGIFALDRSSSQWVALGNTEEINDRNARRQNNAESLSSMVKVNDIEITPKKWLAATSAGLYSSSDEGKTWKKDDALRRLYLVSVRARGHVIAVAGPRKLLISIDDGNTWKTSHRLPRYVNGIQNLTVTPDEQIIIATREGAFRSRNLGVRWTRIYRGLPSKHINWITYDRSHQRLLTTTADSTAVYESQDGGSTWHLQSDTGYLLRTISVVRGRLLATTRFDGLIQQTQGEQELP